MSLKVRLAPGVRGRLFALVGLFALGCGGLAAGLISLQSQQAYKARMQTLQQLVATAHGVLAAHKAMVDAGQIPMEEARKRALNVIRSMWYGKADYFTARDTTGMSLLNPAAPEKEGQNRDASTDSRGKHYSREMTELVQGPGEGYVTYYTLNPETKVDAEKTSYIKLYRPMGIAIAAGVFTDDLAAEMRSAMLQAAAITVALVLLLGGAAIWQAQMIVGALRRLRDAMLLLANGRTDVQLSDVERSDELGEMARAVQVFKENAIRNIELESSAESARSEAEVTRARGEAVRNATAQETESVVHRLGEGLSRLSHGDLTVRLDRFPESFVKLQEDFNEAVAKLEKAMGDIAQAGEALVSGSGEISQASGDLSQRTEQKAASLEETAAALGELTSTVKKTAEGALHAREIVVTAKTDAERSGKVVDDAVQAMNSIERSANEITQIIGVIDEIAFQTNLLALNAGVEAARAGEAGRGFAVVASEVRALAQRSAEAAKEIKSLIATSSSQVASGVALVSNTGEALHRIMRQVTEVAGVVSEIASSAQEQSAGLVQINSAVSEMDRITQQNAAMVEETTAASQSLAQEVNRLGSLIARFQVTELAAGVKARKPAPAAKSPPRAPARPMARGGQSVLAVRPAVQEDSWTEF